MIMNYENDLEEKILNILKSFEIENKCWQKMALIKVLQNYSFFFKIFRKTKIQ